MLNAVLGFQSRLALDSGVGVTAEGIPEIVGIWCCFAGKGLKKKSVKILQKEGTAKMLRQGNERRKR